MPENAPPPGGKMVDRGAFLALPLSFPGVSRPVPPDDSYLHCLAVGRAGRHVYVATRGRRPHLVQMALGGSHGYAVDLKVPEEWQDIHALATSEQDGRDLLFAAVRGTSGAMLVSWRAARMGAGIQEWHVGASEPVELLQLEGPVQAVVVDPALREAAVLMENSLVRVGIGSAVTRLAEISASSARLLARGDSGFVLLEGNGMRHFAWGRPGMVDEASFECRMELAAVWTDGVAWVDGNGVVWERSFSGGVPRRRGRIPLSPVQGMVRMRDGRIYLSAGTEIGHWYEIEGDVEWAFDLGIPVSTLTTRRYGFCLTSMQQGRDGEIYIAENDRGGHLWIYFPRLL